MITESLQFSNEFIPSDMTCTYCGDPINDNYFEELGGNLLHGRCHRRFQEEMHGDVDSTIEEEFGSLELYDQFCALASVTTSRLR